MDVAAGLWYICMSFLQVVNVLVEGSSAGAKVGENPPAERRLRRPENWLGSDRHLFLGIQVYVAVALAVAMGFLF